MRTRSTGAAKVLAGAVAVLLVLTGCTGKDAVDQGAGQYRFVSGTSLGKTYDPGERRKAGDFTGELLDGTGTLTLSQLAGKVVVINFWAVWCSPCITETPQFDLVYRAYRTKGVTFVGIDTKDQRGQAQAFVKDHQISYPMVFDEPGTTAIELGEIPALALPFTVVIDRHGRVAAVYLARLQGADLEPVLDTLLAES